MTEQPEGLPLFRAEALQGRDAPGGALLLARPVGFAMGTALAVFIVLGLLAQFLCCSASATARLPGVLTPESGLLRIVADRDGRVAERRVSEGQAVRAGEVLFVLRGGRGDAQGEGRGESHDEHRGEHRGEDVDTTVVRLLKQRRDSLVAESHHRRQQEAHGLDAARVRIDALREDQRRLASEIALQSRRVALDDDAFDRQRRLQQAGMSTVSAAHAHEIAAIEARQRLSQLEGAWASSRRDERAALLALRAAVLQQGRDEEGHARALAALDQEVAQHQARGETLILAPDAGRVSALKAGPGQSVAAREALAHLWPDGSALEAELQAPARAAAFMTEGLPVRLQVDAFPHQTFGALTGWVRSVDLVAAGPEAAYRVRVRLDRPTLVARGVAHPLRPGMRLQAIVALERRRLYEWVMDPLRRLSATQAPVER